MAGPSPESPLVDLENSGAKLGYRNRRSKLAVRDRALSRRALQQLFLDLGVPAPLAAGLLEPSLDTTLSADGSAAPGTPFLRWPVNLFTAVDESDDDAESEEDDEHMSEGEDEDDASE
ncbi:hypothetical protein JCM10450v2_000239 [Rhodotorula kratochvilovae]